MRIDIKIQSFSGVITNSSSEVFCTIDSYNLGKIYDLLKPLFSGEFDIEPTITIEDETILIWLPYGFEGSVEFYRAGLRALLDQHIGENNYKIHYEF